MTASLKQLDKAWLVFAPVFVVLLGLDQLTKWWAASTLEPGYSVDFGFVLSYNDGIVFGLDLPLWAVWVLTLGILAMGIWLVLENKLWRDKWHLLGFSMIFAGAIGNMIDRLRFGYVIDFIKIYWWPNFNLADVFIVVGALGLMGVILLSEGDLQKL